MRTKNRTAGLKFTVKMKAALAIGFIFLGCISNAVILEVLVREDPGIGNLLTFCQYSFVAVEGFLFTTKCGLAKRNISALCYLTLVVLYFLGCFLSNFAIDLNVPTNFQIICRSGSLFANMILAKMSMGAKYQPSKYVAVAMITAGLVAFSAACEKNTPTQLELSNDLMWTIVGVVLMIIGIFITARMRLYHEILYKRYGKYHREVLFYTHALPLPFFALLAPDILEHWNYAMETPPVETGLGFAVPIAIIYLALNVISHYFCVSSIFALSAQYSSLMVTLMLTLRKFGSLVFSVLYYGNSFTYYHWAGTFLIGFGTAIFTDFDLKVAAACRGKLRTG